MFRLSTRLRKRARKIIIMHEKMSPTVLNQSMWANLGKSEGILAGLQSSFSSSVTSSFTPLCSSKNGKFILLVVLDEGHKGSKTIVRYVSSKSMMRTFNSNVTFRLWTFMCEKMCVCRVLKKVKLHNYDLYLIHLRWYILFVYNLVASNL